MSFHLHSSVLVQTFFFFRPTTQVLVSLWGNLRLINTVDAFFIYQMNRIKIFCKQQYNNKLWTGLQIFSNSINLAKFVKCLNYTTSGLMLSNLLDAMLVWMFVCCFPLYYLRNCVFVFDFTFASLYWQFINICSCFKSQRFKSHLIVGASLQLQKFYFLRINFHLFSYSTLNSYFFVNFLLVFPKRSFSSV